MSWSMPSKPTKSGIVVDFESIPDQTQPNFREFAAELAPALHAVGLKLMIELPARDDAYDYKFFGKECDAIVLMNFDQHWVSSPPGPIAAQDWFVENLRQMLTQRSRAENRRRHREFRLRLARKAANKKWHPPPSSACKKRCCTPYESETDIEFDDASLNPHYSYVDEHNHVHQVWMLDAITGYNQLRASERLGVQGTALWRLGPFGHFHLAHLGRHPARRRHSPEAHRPRRRART